MKTKKATERPLYARNLSYLKNKLRLTRREIAEQSGISESAWGSYEEGRAFPNWKKLQKICDILQYWDILAIITQDLAAGKDETKINISQARASLKIVDSFLKTATS